jgi:hypothetical protein
MEDLDTVSLYLVYLVGVFLVLFNGFKHTLRASNVPLRAICQHTSVESTMTIVPGRYFSCMSHGATRLLSASIYQFSFRDAKRKWDYLIAMDYVNGRTLANYMAENQHGFHLTPLCTTTLSSSTMPPGPLSTHGLRTCESPIFGQVQSHRGPFASYYAELSAFFNERCKMALDANQIPDHHSSRRERFDDSAPLVFTHQDLNPRNIIVGEDGRL